MGRRIAERMARLLLQQEAVVTPVTSFAGKSVAVFGLGGSGLVSCRALVAGGATVLACDDNAKSMEAARPKAFRPAICATLTGRRSMRWCSRPACR